jgi:co-chaperonin GroES (HSP10)
MLKEAIEIKTIVNGLPVDPTKSLLPIQIVGDRVLIEPREADKEYAPGIAKPVNAVEPFFTGKVMCIGGGEYGATLPDHLRVGLQVNYWHNGKVDMVIDKKLYHCVRASDIFMYP